MSALDKQCEAASQKVKEMKIEIDALKQRKAEILTEISTYEIDAAAAVTLAEEIRKQKDQVSQTQAEMVVLQEQGAEAARVKSESLERWQSDLRAQADEIAKEREALEKQKIAFEQAQVAAKTKDEGSPQIAATGSSASVETKASKQSDDSGAKSLAEANAKLAAERKALSAEKNELKKANDKEVKHLQRLHDKLEKSRAAYTKANQAMKSREDKVKAEEEMLSRRHPLIQQLDDAILSMPVSSDSSAGDDNPQVIFSVALTNLRQTLKVDIDQQLAAGKSNIAASAAGRIAIETKVMLEKLRIEGNDRIQVLRDYENKCKHSSLGSKLLKAIGAVCIAAVGFVIGAVIGLTVGMLAGACSGPGAFVTAALGMTTGAAIGMYVAAGGVGVAAGISSGILLFSHGRVTKQAIAAARVGMEAYTPRVLAK